MLFAKMFARQAVRACTASSMTGRVNRTNIVVAARRMNQTSTNEGAQTSSHARPRAVGVDMGKKRSGVLRFAVAGGLAAGILAIGYRT